MNSRLVVLPALMFISGCVPADVVADVAGRRITLADVRATAKLEQKPVTASFEGMLQTEVLAAEARRRKLHERDDVKARLMAAEREILASALLDTETQSIDEKALRARYDVAGVVTVRQVELAHIFVSVAPGADAAAVARAENKATTAWARILGGDEFEVVAKEVSEDTATAAKGGVIGVVREGAISKELFDVAATLAEGKSSRPIQTPFGFYLIKAIKPVTAVKLPWDEARGRLAVEAREAMRVELWKKAEAGVQVKKYAKAIAELAPESPR
ncbi:MAG: peptidylprolyl isomerase [Myxococcales bacterium]|nr:peptidylprolyl isomerase [Myxococcales bacterium]